MSKVRVASVHCVGGKGQNEEEKSLLPSLDQEAGADGRSDRSAFSRSVTLEQAISPMWQQLRLGVREFIRQEFRPLEM